MMAVMLFLPIVATLDNDKDHIADEVGKFFKEVAEKKGK